MNGSEWLLVIICDVSHYIFYIDVVGKRKQQNPTFPCTSNQHDVSAAALTASESNMVESPMSQIYLLALWLASSGSYLFF